MRKTLIIAVLGVLVLAIIAFAVTGQQSVPESDMVATIPDGNEYGGGRHDSNSPTQMIAEGETLTVEGSIESIGTNSFMISADDEDMFTVSIERLPVNPFASREGVRLEKGDYVRVRGEVVKSLAEENMIAADAVQRLATGEEAELPEPPGGQGTDRRQLEDQ